MKKNNQHHRLCQKPAISGGRGLPGRGCIWVDAGRARRADGRDRKTDSVARQQPLHHQRQRHLSRAKQPADMIGNQRPSQTLGGRLHHDAGEAFDKSYPVA